MTTTTFSIALLAAVSSATQVSVPFTMADYYRNYGGSQIDYTNNYSYGHAYPADNYEYYHVEDYDEPTHPQPTPPVEHYHDAHHDEPEFYSNVPVGDFWRQVDEFDEWEEIWGQPDYEERLEQEATLMVALEAMRDALVDLDHDIDNLEDCVSSNDDGIADNHYDIHNNNYRVGISKNDDEMHDQEYRIHHLQDLCRECDKTLREDREFLVLHCQQFAFADAMVGACADILTCRDTELHYKADPFLGHDSDHTYFHEEDLQGEHSFHPQPAAFQPINPAHYSPHH